MGGIFIVLTNPKYKLLSYAFTLGFEHNYEFKVMNDKNKHVKVSDKFESVIVFQNMQTC